MLGPGWEEGCKSCSYLADHFDGANWHLPHRDVTFVVVSRAPLSEIEPFKKRMGWRFKWVSSHGSDFNFDYRVSFTKEEEEKNKVYYNYRMGEFMSEELPGLSVFYKDENGDVFHTYSTYARGLDILVGTYNFLAWTRHARGRLHFSRSGAKRPRRKSGSNDGLGPPPRSVRSADVRIATKTKQQTLKKHELNKHDK